MFSAYFINTKRKKDLRALVGEHSEEIIMEAKIWEKLTGQNFEKMERGRDKNFPNKQRTRIDCSGFVVHV